MNKLLSVYAASIFSITPYIADGRIHHIINYVKASLNV